MNQTPLYEAHVAHGAKLVDFAGWSMPIQYSGVIDEYHAVRKQAGLFDVSHMGRIVVSGGGALPFLQAVTTNDVARLEVNQAQYSMVCNPQGGIKDDIFIYRTEKEHYLVCVNASNREKVLAWLRQQQQEFSQPVEIHDQSVHMAQLALQGPVSPTLLGEVLGQDVQHVKPRRCLETKFLGSSVLITRTGYTGEIGYELYIPEDRARPLWDRLLEVGKQAGLKPAGLASRDLLRLDMGYFLYGNDLTEETTPVEAGAEWVVAFQKEHFIGASVLKKQKEEGSTRRLVAFELLEKAVPRHGMGMFREDQSIGEVTSGNLSPTLQKGIGLGYVPTQYSNIGTNFQVDIRGKKIPAIVVKLPFYKRTS